MSYCLAYATCIVHVARSTGHLRYHCLRGPRSSAFIRHWPVIIFRLASGLRTFPTQTIGPTTPPAQPRSHNIFYVESTATSTVPPLDPRLAHGILRQTPTAGQRYFPAAVPTTHVLRQVYGSLRHFKFTIKLPYLVPASPLPFLLRSTATRVSLRSPTISYVPGLPSPPAVPYYILRQVYGIIRHF